LVSAETNRLKNILNSQHIKGFDELKILIELNREKSLQVELFAG
jgi:hypothetical protein